MDKFSRSGKVESHKSKEQLTAHTLSVHGCVQVLEIIACTVGTALSLVSTQWLTTSGGGYVSFALIACGIFALILYLRHLAVELTGRIKWERAEWIGYLVGFLLLVIAACVCVRAAGIQYFAESEDGRIMLLDNSSILATAVFTILTALFYLFHFILLTSWWSRGRKA